MRQEVQRQLGALGLATKEDLDRVERKLGGAPTARKHGEEGGQEGGEAEGREEAVKAAKKAAKKKSAKPGTAKKTSATKAARHHEGRQAPRRAVAVDARLRRRLDAELVRRGLVEQPRTAPWRRSREGRVRVGGCAGDARPARQVDVGGADHASRGRRPRFVSRGGREARGALDAFAIDVTARRALDAGASTGGFTDCLLQRGAAHVVAVDVGRGAARLVAAQRPAGHGPASAPTSANSTPDAIGGPVERLHVADLSFISLRTVAPALLACTTPTPSSCCWSSRSSRPGRARVGKGGVVRDPAVHRAVLREVVDGLDGRRPRCRRGRSRRRSAAPTATVEFLAHAAGRPRRRRRRRLDAVAAMRTRRPGRSRDRRDRRARPAPRPAGRARARATRRDLARATTASRCGSRRGRAGRRARRATACDRDAFVDGLDLAISLGGDGTMLHTVDLVYRAPVPRCSA